MLIDIDIVNVQTTKTLALTIWEILTGERTNLKAFRPSKGTENLTRVKLPINLRVVKGYRFNSIT